MRIGIGLTALAIAFTAAGAAQAQNPAQNQAQNPTPGSAAQMRVAFDICADFAAGRTDQAVTVAAANAAGFPGDGGAIMSWSGPDAASRVRLSLATTDNRWCVISTSDPAVDAAALSDQAMGWAAQRLEGPWRHARADQPTAADASAITGYNGRLGVTASRPNRGGVRIMVMPQTAAQWDANRTRLGARPVTLDLPAYDPPTPSPVATGPSTRDLVLTALNQCYAFLAGGDRPSLTDTTGVRLTLADRSCTLEVSTPRPDPSLMEAALEGVARHHRGANRSRQETGFSCLMHRVDVSGRDLRTVATCDRLAPAGQVWLQVQATSVR